MKKKIFRALYGVAEKVLDEKEMKELDKEINDEIDKTVKEAEELRPKKKKVGK